MHRALHWAAEKGRHEIVARILHFPEVDVNVQVRGATALLLASRIKDERTVSQLLDAGADPRLVCKPLSPEFGGGMRFRIQPPSLDPSRGDTVLHSLCHRNRGLHLAQSRTDKDPEICAIFSKLMEAGADVHQKKGDGDTALHLAASMNSLVLTRLLLDAGADANVENEKGNLPLHVVKSLDVMALLIESGGANINHRNHQGQTPLFDLVDKINVDDCIIKLLEYNPDCSLRDGEGNGILHKFVGKRFNLEIVQGLLNCGADPNMRNDQGETPLHALCKSNRNPGLLVDALIEAGADIDAVDNRGATALFHNAAHGLFNRQGQDSWGQMQALIDRGASPFCRDFRGRTLLHESLRYYKGATSSLPPDQYRRQSKLDFLLSLGLDPQVTDHDGNSLLHEFAIRFYHGYEHGSQDGQSALLEHLIDLGLNFDQKNHFGRTALHIAAMYYEPNLNYRPTPVDISMIMKRTRDVNSRDQEGLTPLHLAAPRSINITKALLDAGADPRLATNKGSTPLHLAARARLSNTVGLILERLASVDQPSSLQNRLLKTYPQCLLGLQDWLYTVWDGPVPGADSRDREMNSVGSSPLDYAVQAGRPEMVALLLSAGADCRSPTIISSVFDFEKDQDRWVKAFESRGGKKSSNRSDKTMGLADFGLPGWEMIGVWASSSDEDEHADAIHSARIDEILHSMIPRDLTQTAPGYKSYITDSLAGRSDYMINIFNKAMSASTRLSHSREPNLSLPGILERGVVNSVHNAQVDNLRHRVGLEPGGVHRDTFQTLLLRREYDMIEELYHAGADFFTAEPMISNNSSRNGNSNFCVLVCYGMVDLVRRIGRLELGKPSIAMASGPNKIGLYLSSALNRELPNMEVVRVLVEEFDADINEYPPEEFEDPTDNQVEGGPMLDLARGRYWWHAALAIPYFIGRSASLNVRQSWENKPGRIHKAGNQTPLHIALRGKNAFGNDVARTLIIAGADVNAVDDDGRSCLAYSCDDVAMARFLLDHGAVVDIEAIFTAIEHYRVDALELLLSRGVDVIDLNSICQRPPPLSQMNSGAFRYKCFFPVHYAAQHHYLGKRIPDQRGLGLKTWRLAAEMVRILLVHGANPLATYPKALSHGYPPKASQRLQCRTVLHELIKSGDIIHPFLDMAGLDPNTRDYQGQTLWHAACQSRYGPDAAVDNILQDKSLENRWESPSLLSKLVEMGTDACARDHKGRNGLHIFFGGDNFYALKTLLRSEKTIDHMTRNHRELLEQRDEGGCTPLNSAIGLIKFGKNCLKPAVQIFRSGADVRNTRDNEGDTALHLMAGQVDSHEKRALFEEFVSGGLDINARNNEGKTPIFSFFNSRSWASLHGDEERRREQDTSMEMFQRLGADLSVRDNGGRTLLHESAMCPVGHAGEPHRFRLLLEAGLDPMAEDNERRSPIDLAVAACNQGVLKMFEKKPGK